MYICTTSLSILCQWTLRWLLCFGEAAQFYFKQVLMQRKSPTVTTIFYRNRKINSSKMYAKYRLEGSESRQIYTYLQIIYLPICLFISIDLGLSLSVQFSSRQALSGWVFWYCVYRLSRLISYPILLLWF